MSHSLPIAVATHATYPATRIESAPATRSPRSTHGRRGGNPMLGRAPSGDAEVPSQSLADHGRGRLVVAASARGERLAQLGSEANGLNGRRGCTHRRPAAAPAADLVRGRTGRGPLAQFGDGVVGNRLVGYLLRSTDSGRVQREPGQAASRGVTRLA